MHEFSQLAEMCTIYKYNDESKKNMFIKNTQWRNIAIPRDQFIKFIMICIARLISISISIPMTNK